MLPKSKDQGGAEAFWEGSTIGDPLWEEWVLEEEILELFEKPATVLKPHELWVLVPEEPSEQTKPLLVKIAASIGYAPTQLRMVVMGILDGTPSQDWWISQPWSARKVLAFGVSMPEPVFANHQYWAVAPDLNALSADENARKSLWTRIKGWRDA